MPDEHTPDAAKKTVPSQDPDFAARGASEPAPIPEDELPSKEKDLQKARAILEGKDPEVAELIDELKDSDELVEVAKGGKTLRVNPATLDAHLSVGWRIVDADRADAAKARADEPDAGPFVRPPKGDPGRPSRADVPKPADKPKSK